jgi:predicted RND superfamily exporter protein
MTKPFFARRYLAVFLVIAFLTPFIGRGARMAIQSNTNNVKDWLPPAYEESADLAWFQEHFPGEQFAVVTWEGCTLGNTDKLNLLAQKLVPDKAGKSDGIRYFNSVMTGPSKLTELTDPPLSLSRDEALSRLEGSLVGPPVKGGDDQSRTTCLVVTLSQQALRSNRTMRAAIETIQRVAVEECSVPKSELRMGGPPVDNVAIDVEGERTLYRLAGLSGVVGLLLSYWCLRSIRLSLMVFAVGVLSAGLSLALVYYSGLIETTIKGTRVPDFSTVDAVLMSMPAVVYVLGISGAIHIVNYYRDARREGGHMGAAEAALAHGWIPCTLAALTTAMGLASLYISDITPIKKFGVFSAVGVLGTLAILFTLLPASLYRFLINGDGRRPRNEKSRWAPLQASIGRGMRGVGYWIVTKNGWVTAGCILLMVVVGLGLPKIRTSIQLLKLFDEDTDIIHDYQWLETHLGNLVPMEVVVAVAPSALRSGEEQAEVIGQPYRMNTLERVELVRQLQQRIQRLPDVGKALSVATFTPEPPESEDNVIRHLVPADPRWVLNRQLEEHRQQLEADDYLRLEVASRDGKPIEAPPEMRRELWRISARVAALNDVDYGVFDQSIKDMAEPVLEAYRERNEILQELHAKDTMLRGSRLHVFFSGPAEADEPQPGSREALLGDLLSRAGARIAYFNLAQLPLANATAGRTQAAFDEVLRQYDAAVIASNATQANPEQLAAAAPLVVDLRGAAPIAVSQADVPTINAVYTGVIPLVYKTQRQLMISLRESIGWATGLIAIVMVLVWRSPSGGLVSMIPNIFPVVIVFGAMGWLGIKVDIGTMMTASVALGVAVDDTVHMLTWFRRGIMSGLTRKAATIQAYERCASAMLQTTIVGGLGLAVFAFSTFTPTQQFGYLMVTLLGAALVGDLVLLPSLLSSPLGEVFAAGLRKRGVKRDQPRRREGGPPPAHIRRDSPHHSVRT